MVDKFGPLARMVEICFFIVIKVKPLDNQLSTRIAALEMPDYSTSCEFNKNVYS